MYNKLASKYLFIKKHLIDCGYAEEINWQANVCFDEIDESCFLRELAWVILCSGMRETVIRNVFSGISECFLNWISSEYIVKNKSECYYQALKYFNNENKISAIIRAADEIDSIGFHLFKETIRENPIEKLQEFSYIGPVTVYHLVKNIGLPFAKPDRHLKRIAKKEGYSDVQKLCHDVSKLTGDSKPVVDIVFWRFATITRDYLDVLSYFDDAYEIFKANGD